VSLLVSVDKKKGENLVKITIIKCFWVYLGLVGLGLVWFGLVWFGLVWFGLV